MRVRSMSREGNAMSDAARSRNVFPRWVALAATISLLAGVVVWVGCSDKGNVNPFNPSDVPINFIGSLTASPKRVNAGDQEAMVTVFIIDENGAPVSGIPVVFRTDIGTVDSMGVTDAQGFARTTFVSGTTEGTARIIASLGSFQKEVAIQVGQGELIAGVSSLIADGSSSTTMTAQVLDEFGQPRLGVPVFFESTAGFITPTAFTQNNGKAEATLRSIASRTDVEALVTAKIASPDVAGEFIDIGDAFATFRGISVEMTIDEASLVADGEDSTFVRTLVKETTSQVTVPQVIVAYGTTLGSISSTDSTDATGYSVATLFAGVEPGSATVTGTVFGALSDTVTAEFTPLTLRILGASPTTIPSDGSSQTAVTAILLNSSNNPVAGKAISFSTTAGVITGVLETGDDGKAIAMLTSSADPDTAMVIAAFGSLRDTIEVSMTSLAEQIPSSILIRTASPKIQVAQTGGSETTTLTAELFNERGDLIQSGFDVEFTITEGPAGGEYLGAPSNGTGPVSVPVEDGAARIALSSGVLSGTIEVTASVPPLLSVNSRVVIGAGPPDSISLNISEVSAPLSGALFSFIVTATIVDRYSNTVEDSTAVFFAVSADSCGSGQPLPDVAIDGLAFTHNLADCPGTQSIAHGVAVTCLKAPYAILDDFPNFWLSAETSGGTVKMCKNFTSGSAPGPAASIALSSVAFTSIGVTGTGQNSSSELVFEVRDATGEPVNQDNAVEVFFEFTSSPGGGAYLSPTTVSTDALGLARTSVNSGTVSGVAKVRAAVVGSSPLVSSEVASVVVSGGPPDFEHFSLAMQKSNIAGRLRYGLEDQITAFIFDKYSNPVPPGTVVSFSTNRGGITGSAITNAFGQAVATLYTAAPSPTCADTGYAYVSARTVDEYNETIEAQARVLMTGSTQITVVYPETPTFTVPDGGSVPIIFFVGDDCGNPLVELTFINFEFSGASTFVGDTSVQLPDTQSQGATYYAVTAYDGTPGDTATPTNCFIKISVTNSANGNASFIYSGTID